MAEDPRETRLDIQGMPWRWQLDRGDVELFGLPSVAFWTRPSLERLLGPLRAEVGDDLYRLLVAYYSSLGTEEDYHAMITSLGSSFEEGFLAWGAAVSTAGWGRFSLPHLDADAGEAVVRVDNPWELQMQGPDESWGCPFLQGKLIGIFNHAFDRTCWADEQLIERGEERSAIEFRIAPSRRTISVELEELRRRRQRERDGELAREVEAKTAQLREAQERQRAVLSSLSDLVFTVDDELRIQQYLPPRDQLRGFPARDQVEGRRVAEVFTEELAASLGRALAADDDGAAPSALDFASLVDGEPRSYNAHFVPRHSAAGEREGLTVVVRDTTEQRRIEAQLRQSQKMESIGLLAGGVAHDFNNLLAAMVSSADLLALQVPAELRGLVETILEASETAGGLVRKLLDFSGRGQVQRRTFDAHEVLKGTASLLARSVSRTIHVSTSLDAERYHLRGDPHQLRSALLNLGVNARDAIAEGGEISFSTHNLELDAEACAAASVPLEPGTYLEISVRDTGEGMSPELVDRIFEPFFTTKDEGKGTGLGLPAVYGAVTEHRGEIRVESELGRGTCFRVRLPVTAPVAKPKPKPKRSQSSARAARILLADDDAIVLGMAEQLLRQLGHEVVTAKDGAAALAIYREQRERIDLVILDVVMPELGGYEAFHAIRALDPGVPVIFASGFTRRGAITEDIQDFVHKPYRLDELARAVNGALGADPKHDPRS